MKLHLSTIRVRILFLWILFPFFGNSQSNDFFTFDSNINPLIYRDTISNSNCIWQIGQPQKTVFNTAYSTQNSIITDTVNYYPINDTSSFIYKHEVSVGFLNINSVYPIVELYGYYNVNSDSLNDYGKIEFSPDNGLSWVLISDDTLTLLNSSNPWPYIENNPVLTGNSNGWKYFKITLSGYDQHVFNTGDTIQYKFTFISDGNSENMDGLMFDNLNFIDDGGGGIVNKVTSSISNYPNPFTNTLNLNYNLLTNGELSIFDVTGKLIHSETIKSSNTTVVNTSNFTKGVYFYKLVDTTTGLSVGNGKIVK